MFCHNCGANAGNAKYCPECGTRIVGRQDSGEVQGSGMLTLRKYKSDRMKNISADIYIDGAFQTVLGNTESTSFTLPAGTHELLIHADGCVDALQHVTIEPLVNKLCIFSVDDIGVLNIVQDGSPGRTAGHSVRCSSEWSRQTGTAVAFAEPQEYMPVTRIVDDYLDDTWSEENLDAQSNTYSIPRNSKFSKFCGALIHEESVVCPSCGRQVEELRSEATNVVYQQNNSSNTYVDNRTTVTYMGKAKNKWVAFFLCLFLGYLGIHKFYEGKVGMGILYLFTLGFFGIGALIDLIAIVMKPNPYYV